MVIDNTPPMISVNGANPLAAIQAYPFIGPALLSATPMQALCLSTSRARSITSVIGTYTITCAATNTTNNTGAAMRTVNVIYRSPPSARRSANCR